MFAKYSETNGFNIVFVCIPNSKSFFFKTMTLIILPRTLYYQVNEIYIYIDLSYSFFNIIKLIIVQFVLK